MSFQVNEAIGSLSLTGTVTCMSVTGPDQGGGTATAPTSVLTNF